MNDAVPVERPPAGRLLVLSPHLDDGVFACGRLLASVADPIVATIFAGRPPPGSGLTDWDRAAGFNSREDVVGRRRREDRQALAILGAEPRWLSLRDSQYGTPPRHRVVGRLRQLFEAVQPDTVAIPLGLFHSDHRLAHDAALALFKDYPACRWLVYEDALYRRIDGLRDQGLARLRRLGLATRPVRFAETPGAADRKRAAVVRYRSQLKALATPGRPGCAALADEEAYWQIDPESRSSHEHAHPRKQDRPRRPHP